MSVSLQTPTILHNISHCSLSNSNQQMTYAHTFSLTYKITSNTHYKIYAMVCQRIKDVKSNESGRGDIKSF
jgi:hypothetical protein